MKRSLNGIKSLRRRTVVALCGAITLFASTLAFVVAPASALNPPLASWDPVGSGVMQLNNNAPNGANPTTIPTTPPSDAFDHVYCQVVPSCATKAGPTVALGGANAVAFDHSPSLNATNFAGNSKDILDLTGWNWSSTGGLPGKDILLDSAAARYSPPIGPGGSNNLQTCPSSTPSALKCSSLYFASDRYDNSGDAQQGFWFLQNNVFPAANGTFMQTNPDGSVSPAVHKVGDLLVVSDFSVGGTSSTIDVYEWVGSGGNTNGTLQFLSGGNNEACSLVTAPASLCGQVNSGSSIVTSPWPFTDKKHNSGFDQGEYYNGGINLTQFPALAKECFGSFTAESRSSTSPTATLEDFIMGNFARCGSSTTSTPQQGNGTNIPPSGVSIGSTGNVTVQDSATVTGLGADIPPTGSVDFHLCGSPATSCPSGSGVDVGSTALGGTSNPTTVTSPPVGISAVGSYCFRADYSGDSNYPKSTDGSAGECFTVNPVTAGVTTTASSGPVPLGTAIDDTAHLTGTANEPGTPVINPTTAGGAAKGQITFNLYGPNDATCTTAIETSVVNVSGNNDYNASTGTLSGTLGSLTPKAAGTYRWIANYGGDPPNTLANPANGCNGTNESVVVSPNQPTISTQGTCAPPTGCPLGTAIDDTATLGGTANEPNGTAAQGKITFNLYGPNDPNCSNGAIETSVVSVNGNGTYKASSGTLSGSLGSLTPTLHGTYNWTASYSGDPPNTLGVSEGCGGTNEASLLFQLTPTIATAQSFVPNDSAHIQVTSGAGNLAGSVEFKLFVNNPTCDSSVSAAAYDSGPIDVTTGSGTGTDRTLHSNNATSYGTTGTTFSWLVTFTSTNPGHTGVTSSCSENSNISINNG